MQHSLLLLCFVCVLHFPLWSGAQEFFGLDPGSGVAGDIVLLQAEGLDTGASYTVTVGEIAYPGFSVTADGIQLTIPQEGKTGVIELTIDGVSVDTGSSLEVLRPISGSLNLPAGMNPADYAVGTFPNVDLEAGNNGGAFSTRVQAQGANLIMAVREENDPVFMKVVTSADSSPVIDAQSTAVALAFLSPALSARTDADAADLLSQIQGLPETSTLGALIESASDDGTDYLVDPEVETAWIALNNALVSNVSLSGPTEFAPSNSDISFKTGTPDKTYILEIDEGLPTDRSTQAELKKLEGNQGYKLTVKEIQSGANPVNWNIQLWEIDPDQFPLGFKDVLRNHQGTYFTEKSLGTIDVGFLSASLAGKKFDLPGQAVDFIAGLVMSSTKPDLGPNDFRLPNRPGIYMARNFSGNVWYRADVGLISTSSQANLIQELDQMNASNYAFASNVLLGAVDVVKIFYNPGASTKKKRNLNTGEVERVPFVSENFEGFLGNLFYSAVEKAINEGTQVNDTDVWYNILGDVTKASLSYMMTEGFNASESTTGVGEGLDGKLGRFISGGTKILTGIFDVFGKAGAAINTIQRAGGIFGPTALAAERSLIVIGDPFDPEISSFLPVRGKTGDRIRIYGRNFGMDKSAITVAFCNVPETQTEDLSDLTPPPTTNEVQATVLEAYGNSLLIEVPEGMDGLDQAAIYLCVEKVAGNYTTTRFNLDERYRTFQYIGKPVLAGIDSSPAFAGSYVTLSGEDFSFNFQDELKVKFYDSEGNFSFTGEQIVKQSETEATFRTPTISGDYQISIEVNGVESEQRLPLTLNAREVAAGDPPRNLICFVDSLDWVDDPDDPTLTILEAFKILAGERIATQHLPGERLQEDEIGYIPPQPRETDRVGGDAQYVGDPVTFPASSNVMLFTQSFWQSLSLEGTVINATSTPPLASHTIYQMYYGRPVIFDFGGNAIGFEFDGIDGVTMDSLYVQNTGGDGVVFKNDADRNAIGRVSVENAGGHGILFQSDSDANQLGVFPGLAAGDFQSTVINAGSDGIRIEGASDDNYLIDFQVDTTGGHGVHLTGDAYRNFFTILSILNPGLNGYELNGAGVRLNTAELFYSNRIHHAVENAGNYGVHIAGGASGNLLSPGRIFNSGLGGILIEGNGTDGNVIGGIGLSSFPLFSEVLEQTAGFGIKIDGGAQANVIREVNVGGFNEDGIIISGIGTDYNVLQDIELGYAKYLFSDVDGTTVSVTDLADIDAPIAGNGIVLTAGASRNRLHGIMTFQIDGSGILIEGEGTNGNQLTGSDLRGGVIALHIAGGAKDNVIGGDDRTERFPSGGDDRYLESNLILSGSQTSPRVMIEGTGTERNILIGNDLSFAPFGGIVIGGPPSKPYTTGSVGIHLRNGAADNRIGIPGSPIRELDEFQQETALYFNGNEFAGGIGILIESTGGNLGNSGELEMPNRIQGNALGSVFYETIGKSFGNGLDIGIQIKGNAEGNIIGGDTPEAGNRVKASIGLDIVDNAISTPSLHNRILNNEFGYDSSNDGFGNFYGNIDDPCLLPQRIPDGGGFPNWDAAVRIRGSSTTGNIIGESILNPNRIQNMAVGVLVEDGATGNLIRGNLIYGNELTGVLFNSVDENTLGGSSPLERNHIFDNGKQPTGSQIRANVILCEADRNLIQSNRIGYDATDSLSAYNESMGLLLVNSAENFIGGSSLPSGNWIGGQAEDGIRLEGSLSSGNTVRFNSIGTSAFLTNDGNGEDGIELLDGANGNLIGGRSRLRQPGGSGSLTASTPNRIWNNATAGVSVLGTSTNGNSILHNSFSGNGGKGIELNGTGNNGQVPPVVSFVSPTSITGSVPDINDIPAGSIVQMFADTDPTSPEGRDLIGTARVRSGGAWIMVPLTDPSGLNLTVTATHATTEDTSEFDVPGDAIFSLPFNVSRADGNAPSTGVNAVFDGNGALEVLALSLVAGPSNPIQVTGMVLTAGGTAPDPLFLDGVCLYADSDASGSYSAGDTLLAGPKSFLVDNGPVTLRPDSLVVNADSEQLVFIVYKKTNTLGSGQTFDITLLTSGQVSAENQSPGSGPAFVGGSFPIRSDLFTLADLSGGSNQFTVSVVTENGGTVTGAGSYSVGETASLEAIPDEFYRFTGWEGDIHTRINPLVFEVTGTVSLSATFQRQPRAFDRSADVEGTGFTKVPGLGYVWMEFFPWIFKPGMGWMYVVEADEESVWLYFPAFGWLWTKPEADFENYFYRVWDGSWIYYLDGEPGSRRFYIFAEGGSVEEDI